MPDTETPEGAVAQLRRIVADLDGYIERRASELAAPLIEQARIEAAQVANEYRAEAEFQRDVAAELRRIVDLRDRQLDELRVRLGERRDPFVAAAEALR